MISLIVNYSISFMARLCSERREQDVFEQLLAIVPKLDERLLEASDEDLIHICSMVRTINFFIVYNVTKSLKIASERHRPSSH